MSNTIETKEGVVTLRTAVAVSGAIRLLAGAVCLANLLITEGLSASAASSLIFSSFVLLWAYGGPLMKKLRERIARLEKVSQPEVRSYTAFMIREVPLLATFAILFVVGRRIWHDDSTVIFLSPFLGTGVALLLTGRWIRKWERANDQRVMVSVDSLPVATRGGMNLSRR